MFNIKTTLINIAFISHKKIMRRLNYSICLLFVLFSTGILKGQVKYSGSHIALSSDNKKMIVSDIWSNSIEDYRGYTKSSKLYSFPLDCSKSKELILCDNYRWSGDNKYFTGYNSYNYETYLYDSTGRLIDRIQNAYEYSFVLSNFHVFYREYDTVNQKRICQLVQHNVSNGLEEVLFSFGEMYTFYDPEDHDGFGFPKPLDYYWGGVRGVVFKITNMDDAGDIMEFETYTFVVSGSEKKLKYLIKGHHLEKKPLPKEQIVTKGL